MGVHVLTESGICTIKIGKQNVQRPAPGPARGRKGDENGTTIEAIYEDGVLRPVQPLDGWGQSQWVTVTVRGARPAGRRLKVGGGADDEDGPPFRTMRE